jgi:hypothetical protein
MIAATVNFISTGYSRITFTGLGVHNFNHTIATLISCKWQAYSPTTCRYLWWKAQVVGCGRLPRTGVRVFQNSRSLIVLQLLHGVTHSVLVGFLWCISWSFSIKELIEDNAVPLAAPEPAEQFQMLLFIRCCRCISGNDDKLLLLSTSGWMSWRIDNVVLLQISVSFGSVLKWIISSSSCKNLLNWDTCAALQERCTTKVWDSRCPQC